MELLLPVKWHAAARTGCRLVERMVAWWREEWALYELVGAIVVEPVFAGLETRDDRMPSRLCVFRRVLLRRVVAASDVAAEGAPPQVEPPAAVALTLFATVAAGSGRGVDRICAHRFPRSWSLFMMSSPSTLR